MPRLRGKYPDMRREPENFIVVRDDKYGYPRFADSRFMSRSEASQVASDIGDNCYVIQYGEYKRRRDPDTMSERELRRRFGGNVGAPHDRKSIVITGSLDGMTRDEARRHAESKGYRVVSKVSPSTDLVWAGEKPGPSKVKEATRYNVPIVNCLEY